MLKSARSFNLPAFFYDIFILISSLEEVSTISKKLVETRMRCTQNQAELDDLKRKILDKNDKINKSGLRNDS
jgi:hypothetical protein